MPISSSAAGVGNTPVGTPQQTGKVTAIELARTLLEHGANPNTRVEWNEPRFGKEGGTARNPPNIRLGRHLLSYRGATLIPTFHPAYLLRNPSTKREVWEDMKKVRALLQDTQ